MLTSASHQPQSKVSLNFSCTGLANLDVGSKSDPQVFVYQKAADGGQTLVGKTEKKQNDLNPKFTTTIEMPYFFEEVQNLRIVVFDIDKDGDVSKNQDFIGEICVTLASLVSRKTGFTGDLQCAKKQHRGKITILCEETQTTAQFDVKLRLSGIKLDKKDVFGKSDPYIIFHKLAADGKFVPVHQTETIMNTLNPGTIGLFGTLNDVFLMSYFRHLDWKQINMPASVLCGGDVQRKMKLEVFDWDKSSAHDLSTFECTLQELAVTGAEFELIHPEKKKKSKSYQNSGKLKVVLGELVRAYSFLDYIRSGFQINLMVAVDYTMSNGDPKFSNSLHYMDPTKPNEYQCAMNSVASILLEYDSDKMIAAYGFGATVAGAVSHCFPLTFNPTQPEVPALMGLMTAYQNATMQVALYGPTNFAPTIEMACAVIQARRNQYLVLLILTDGEITDMDATLAAIVKASTLPLSIVIVGVGQADFAAMRVLDGDEGGGVKDRNGNRAARDIVQFVAFRDFAKGPLSALAAATLAEIPSQFTSYMKANNVVPLTQ